MSDLIPIDEVVYFDVITSSPTTAAAIDADSTPTFDVYEEATDTGLLGATNFTKRTSLTGNYRGTFTASAANGFEAGKWYSVIASATVGAVAGKCVAKSFRCAPAESQAGVPKIDVAYLLGTGWLAPAVAGTPDVNAKQLGGTAQTGRDVGASVLLSAGSGAGQLDLTSGVVKANLAQILGTALTETAGQLAAAFKKFFDKAAPTGTINSIPDAAAGAASGLAIVGSNVGVATSVSGAVGSVTGNVGGNVVGSVGSVTGAVGSVTGAVGSVTGSVGSVTGLTASNLDTTVSSRSSHTAADVWAVGARTLTAFSFAVDISAAAVTAIWAALTVGMATVGSIGKLLVDRIDAAISSRLATVGYTTPPTAAAVADQVWEEAVADHSGTAGSTAAALVAAGATGDPWSTAVPGAYGAGTAGKILGDNLNAAVSTRSVPGDAMALTSGERTTLAASIWNALTSGMSTVGSIGKKLADWVVGTIDTYTGNTPQTGDAFARLGAPAGASTAADIAGVLTAVGTRAAPGDAMTLTAGERNGIADAYLDRTDAIEVGLTPRGEARLTAAASAGKLSGAATTTIAIRNAVADSKDRITATVTSDGDRTAVTTDVT